MNVEILARVQFAFTIAFHYIYPPLSIGLGLILVLMEGLYLKTKQELYHEMTRFWVRIFALTFAIGVATGIVMEFEFGTNWATYSRYVGDVFGSALAAEGIFAFFLESGFLAILVFGWDRVPPRLHFFSTLMVALGSTLSAVWIVVANSWQQTPAGFHIVGKGLHARAEITDFWAMVFNPSSVDRLSHVVVGAWLSGAFLVTSVSAYYLLKGRHTEFARASMQIGLAVAVFASCLQLFLGDRSADGVARNQPAKLAAYEGHFDSSRPMDLYLMGYVNEREGKVTGLKIPGMGSWLLYGDASRPVKGLDAFPAADRPPTTRVFQTYHLMIAIGMGLIGLSLLCALMLWRGRLWTCRPLLQILVLAVLGPQLANQLGWFSAEMGRQPWVVYGLLRTSDALSKAVKANQIVGSLLMFGAVYALLFALFIFLLDRRIKAGPGADEHDAPHLESDDGVRGLQGLNV
jgi:cytochrome d ubiquinol oxidase subunit I